MDATERGSRAVRVAAGMHLFLGVAFGASVPVVLSHLARHGELPMSPFGWRYMAGRPVEHLSPDQFIAGLGARRRLGPRRGRWYLALAWSPPRPQAGARHGRSGPRPRCRLRTAAAARRRADPHGAGIGGASEPPMSSPDLDEPRLQHPPVATIPTTSADSLQRRSPSSRPSRAQLARTMPLGSRRAPPRCRSGCRRCRVGCWPRASCEKTACATLRSRGSMRRRARPPGRARQPRWRRPEPYARSIQAGNE
jgi:hypothetical protein